MANLRHMVAIPRCGAPVLYASQSGFGKGMLNGSTILRSTSRGSNFRTFGRPCMAREIVSSVVGFSGPRVESGARREHARDAIGAINNASEASDRARQEARRERTSETWCLQLVGSAQLADLTISYAEIPGYGPIQGLRPSKIPGFWMWGHQYLWWYKVLC